MLLGVVNSCDNCIEKVTIKYLTVGHTFMSADNFHKAVEHEMKKMDKVYHFNDFTACVGKAGDYVTMSCNDFYDFQSGLSGSKVSKTTRPLLRNVSVMEFRRGSLNLFFKLRHDSDNFQEADFLKQKVKGNINILPEKQEKDRGISSKKLSGILSEFRVKMPSDRVGWFEKLPINENAVDLSKERE